MRNIFKEKLSSFHITVTIWPILLFIAIFLDKFYYFFSTMRFLEGMGYPAKTVMATIFIQDFSLLSLIIIFTILYVQRRMRFMIIFILGLNILYFADSQLFQSLNRRLTYLNIYRYIDEPAAIASFISLKKLLLILAVLVFIWFFRKAKYTFYRGRFILCSFVLIGIMVPWFNWTGRPFDACFDGVTSDIFQVNKNVVIKRGISSTFYLQLRKGFPDMERRLDLMYSGELDLEGFLENKKFSQAKLTPPEQRQNIIVLISESLSQIDSLRSGGVFNRLPHIDKIQAEGLTLTNIVSNGINTSDALASLLASVDSLPTPLINDNMLKRFPVQPFSYNRIFMQSMPNNACGQNLICYANKLGYRTLFVTNSTLDFQKCGDWLKILGFDYIEGSESDFFRKFPHYAFNSPSDEILYQRAIEVIKEQTEPFFLVLLTVSLHGPYILPDEQDRLSGDPLLSQLNYIDRTTSNFYYALRNSGFFKNGMLLVIGDHRRLSPFEPEEFTHRGLDSYGRVIASFIGKGFKPGMMSSAPLNHTDISALLRRMIRGDEVLVDNLMYYNKGYLIGINEAFTTSVISDNYGLVLVRRINKLPWIVKISRNMDLSQLSYDPVDQKIAVYIALRSGWLSEKQEEREGF